jgi:hypothetical protein
MNFEGKLRTPSLAYNPDDGQLYGVAINKLTMFAGMTGKGWVYTIDPAQAITDGVANVYLNGKPNGRLKGMFGTAFDVDGNWFGVNTKGAEKFYAIDKDMGTTTHLGNVDDYFPGLDVKHAGASYDPALSDASGSAFTLLLGNLAGTNPEFDEAIDVKVDFGTNSVVSAIKTGDDVFKFDGRLVATELDLCDSDAIYAVRNGDTFVTSVFPVVGDSQIDTGVTMVGTDAVIRFDNMTGVAVEQPCEEECDCEDYFTEEDGRFVKYEFDEGTYEGNVGMTDGPLEFEWSEDGKEVYRLCVTNNTCATFVVSVKGGNPRGGPNAIDGWNYAYATVGPDETVSGQWGGGNNPRSDRVFDLRD